MEIECQWEQHTALPLPPITLQGGEDVLAYLVKKDGRYTFANLWRPYELVSQSAIDAAKGTSDMDFEGFLIKCLDEQNAVKVCRAIKLLEEGRSAKSLSRIEQLSQSSDKIVRGRALAFCLRATQKSEVLQKAVQYIDDTEPAEVPVLPEIQEQRGEIFRQIINLKDPKLLPTLHAMLSHSNNSIRQEAAIAVRQIAEGKSEQEMAATVPHMIRCLDDADETVRHFAATTLNAVLGHPELNGKLLQYTPDDISEVANFWKTWWQTEDAAKFKTAQ